MTKKQLKQLAKKIADLEYTVQTSEDHLVVNLAKDRLIQIQESSDLDLTEMIVLDEMIQNYLQEKI